VRDRHGPSLFGKWHRLHLGGASALEFVASRGSSDIISVPCDAAAAPEVCACRPAMVVQSSNRAPTAAAQSVRLWVQGGEERLRNVTSTLSLLDKVYVINSAYAWLHGHSYVFARVNNEGGRPRHPAWAKLPLLKHLVLTCPGSKMQLYLDSDAYVRALDEPLRTQWALASGRTFAFSPECAWFSTAAGSRSAIRDMATHQRAMDDNATLENGDVGMLNSGVFAVLNLSAAPSFLDAWSDAPNPEIFALNHPWEQPALTSLLQSDAARRREVLMLDPAQFNGPDGQLIRHLYGPAQQTYQTMQAAHIMTDVDEMLLRVAQRVGEKGPDGADSKAEWHALMPDFRY
jgi:hypothetical protein